MLRANLVSIHIQTVTQKRKNSKKKNNAVISLAGLLFNTITAE